MKLFENKIDYAVEKFRLLMATENDTLIRCYRNRLTYGCGYIKEIEDAIDTVLETDHCHLWWLDHIT